MKKIEPEMVLVRIDALKNLVCTTQAKPGQWMLHDTPRNWQLEWYGKLGVEKDRAEEIVSERWPKT